MGGDATFAGTNFQAAVAAYFATHMLANRTPEFLDLDPGEHFTSLQLESPEPVDDILIHTSSKRRCLVNVKTRVHVSSASNSPLASITDQIVRQWIHHRTTTETDRSAGITDPHPRIAVVVGSPRSARFEGLLRKPLEIAAGAQSLNAIRNSLTKKETNFYDALLELIRTAVRKHLPASNPEDPIMAILRMIRVKKLDPNDTDTEHLHQLLASTTVQDINRAPAALNRIQLHCAKLAELRGQTNTDDLRSLLRKEGIRLRDDPRYATAINKLRTTTEDEIKKTNKRHRIKVPTSTNTKAVSIKRPVSETVLELSKSSSLLLVGPPGSGKSAILYDVAQRLLDMGHPVVVIAVDKHPVQTLNQLSRDMNLDCELLDILSHWSGEKDGVILIDALDATREGISEDVYRKLIAEIKQNIPAWHVIASIREFDLSNGVHYRNLFKDYNATHRFQSNQFPAVSHVWIDQFTEEELQQVWSESEILFAAYRDLNQPIKELLRTPFNLHILADILHADPQLRPTITVQADLLEIYWNFRVNDSPIRALERRLCVRQLTDMMLSQHRLRVKIYPSSLSARDLSFLARDGVLNIDQREDWVEFSHHILFDYAVSRWTTDQNQISELMERITGPLDNALMVAPGAKMVFQSLWSRDRQSFWNNCIVLASGDVRQFCKIIPATVVAELTEHPKDLEPIIQLLADCEHSEYDVARSLLSHCVTALDGFHESDRLNCRNATWIRIAIRITEVTDGKSIHVFYMLLRTWINIIQSLDDHAQRSVGELSRQYLVYNLDAVNDRFGMELAIRGIIRTLQHAPSESLAALNRLLELRRVREHGHADLQFIVNHLDALINCGPCAGGFICHVYRVLFAVSPDSPSSPTILGENSRIMRFTSDREQDFKGAKYGALMMYPRYFERLPVSATEALIAILDLEHEVDEASHGPVEKFSVEGIIATYRPDNSHVKYHFFQEDCDPPLQQFEQGLIELVDEGRVDDIDGVLKTCYRSNCSAALWASILRAGKARLASLGNRLLALASAEPVLHGLDCRSHAIDLVCSLHTLAEAGEKQLVESRLLEASDSARVDVLMHLDRNTIASAYLQNEYDTLAKDGKLRVEQPVIASHGVSDFAYDDQSSYSSDGVNRDDPRLRQLSDLIDRGRRFEPGNSDMTSGSINVREHWEYIGELYRRIEEDRDVPDNLRASGWDRVIEGVGTLVRAAESVEQLVNLDVILRIVFAALDDDMLSVDCVDDEVNVGSGEPIVFGSTTPRGEATGVLLEVIRISTTVDCRMCDKVVALACDRCPFVRERIFECLGWLHQVQPKLAFRLCDVGFSREDDPRLLSSLLRFCRPLLRHRLAWFCTHIVALDDHHTLEAGQDEIDERLSHEVADSMLWLWLVHDQRIACERVWTWASDPIRYEDRIRRVLSRLRKALVQGDLHGATAHDARVRRDAVRVLETVTRNLVGLDLMESTDLELIRKDAAVVRSAFRILEQAMLVVYIASGAPSDTEHVTDGPSDVPMASRFLREVGPTLSLMARVPCPPLCHRLLEMAEYFISVQPRRMLLLITSAVLQGGNAGGYQLERLAAELFVRIVRRYIADHREVLRSDDVECRDQLLDAVDLFVDAGWPRLGRLVYGLPEMLR